MTNRAVGDKSRFNALKQSLSCDFQQPHCLMITHMLQSRETICSFTAAAASQRRSSSIIPIIFNVEWTGFLPALKIMREQHNSHSRSRFINPLQGVKWDGCLGTFYSCCSEKEMKCICCTVRGALGFLRQKHTGFILAKLICIYVFLLI